MNLMFRSEIIDYDFISNDECDKNVIILHGWGGNKKSFNSTIGLLSAKYNILTLTLPTVEETVLPFTLNDYAEIVMTLIKLHNLKNLNIICHSFGFRVVSLMNVMGIKFEKIIITGGTGLRKKSNVFSKLRSENIKILLCNKRYKFLYQKVASKDYKNLSDTNKITFKNIVNIDTKNYINFDAELLLFWGEKDMDTKVWIAKKIVKKNKSNSTLIKIKNGGHFSYLTHNQLFNNEVLRFI